MTRLQLLGFVVLAAFSAAPSDGLVSNWVTPFAPRSAAFMSRAMSSPQLAPPASRRLSRPSIGMKVSRRGSRISNPGNKIMDTNRRRIQGLADPNKVFVGNLAWSTTKVVAASPTPPRHPPPIFTPSSNHTRPSSRPSARRLAQLRTRKS